MIRGVTYLVAQLISTTLSPFDVFLSFAVDPCDIIVRGTNNNCKALVCSDGEMMTKSSIFMNRNTALFASAVIIILSFSRPACADNEQLRLVQSDNGEVTAQLSGTLYRCTIRLDGTTVSFTGTEINVTTDTVYLLCPWSDIQFPYTLTAGLGVLPHGDYHLNWSFRSRENGYRFMTISQTFSISSGAPVEVPSMTDWGKFIFMMGAGLCSIFFIRWAS